MNKIKQNLLFICATHGDEGFSVSVVKNLSKRFKFDWMIGNPKAFRKNVRFIESDLNRSGPGDSKSKYYEERRAKQNIKLAKKYKRVIDLHGTISNSGIFIILSDPNWENIELAKTIPIKRVVLWPSLLPTGPTSQFIPNCLEIECGPKDNPKTARKLEKILSQYLSKKNSNLKQDYYIVVGKFKKKTNRLMKDFVKFTENNDSFYPLLVSQYRKFKCYKMQKLNDTL